ncbi:hypothetical protein FPV67DRAFT_1133285 [Lyophyllum atratum]|nr:hypothetical protein FPV67DRAFT_1133285 [Lyophyllum atratum]
MTAYTFGDKDILNSSLIPSYPSMPYIITTKAGFLGPKATTLSPTPQRGSYPVLSGAILWSKDSFEIDGVPKWSELKNRPKGFLSSTWEWRWSGQRYSLKRHDKHWTARSSSSSYAASVTFTLRKSHLFSPTEPASITFAPDVPAQDIVFLILVMLYSETRRKEDEEDGLDVIEEILA